ncbi:MAG: hypothetical protein HQK75_16415 [Candidatus Magnetomorum sp.]|nr:hypothetical protein [Candidatus Magnetomorum sp.]
MKDDSSFWDTYFNHNFESIKTQIKGYFPKNPEMGKQAVSYVLEKIIQNIKKNYRPDDWKSLDLYISTSIRWEIGHFKETIFARKRIPKPLYQKNNFLWIKIYQLLCWHKMSDYDVIEYLKLNTRFQISLDKIEQAIKFIQNEYPNCTSEIREQSVSESVTSDESDPEQALIKQESQHLIRLLFSNTSDKLEYHHPVYKKIRKINKTIQPEHKVFFRMILDDGFTIKEAGKKLGWNVNQANGVYRRIIKKLAPLKKDLKTST